MELMISFSIIAMIGSMLSLWVIKKIEKERFYSDIKQFEKVIAFCKKMAKVRQADIFCILKQTPAGIKYEVKNISLAKEKNLIAHSNMKIKEEKTTTFQIEFDANGNIYPRTSICFYSKNNKYSKELCLEAQFKLLR